MRIAMVHSYYLSDGPSGENAVVDAQVAALRRAGHDVTLFAVRTDEERTRFGYQIASAARVATGLGRNDLERIEALQPDVVHVHNLFPNMGRRWVTALTRPFVHTLHNYRPLCAAGTLYRVDRASATGGEMCMQCVGGNTLPALRYRCYRGSIAATLPLAIANRKTVADPVLRHARLLIVLNATMRWIYEDAGVEPDRLVQVPNFLADELDGGPGRGGGTWLYVGRLAPEKGVLDLVQRWPATVPLRIVGSGPLTESVARAAAGKQVELLGTRNHTEVLELMRGALGLVFPSRWPEGFPLVYAEALSAGLPVLAWPENSLADLVAAEGTGMVCGEAGAPDDDLDGVLAHAGSAFTGLRRHCRAVFEQHYTEQAHVRALEAVYERALDYERSSMSRTAR